MKKKKLTKIKRVTKSNLKDYLRKNKMFFSYGMLFLFSVFFLGVSTIENQTINTLPQTGESLTGSFGEFFANFIHSPLGNIILVVLWVLYVILLVSIFRNKSSKKQR
jgi:hypothetical protein